MYEKQGLPGLLYKYEIDCCDEADESRQMVPMQTLSLEKNIGDEGEDDERYAFLYHFELYQGEGTTIVDETYAVGWHLATVLKESYRPTKNNDSYQRPIAANASLLEFQVTIPCQCHENVAKN